MLARQTRLVHRIARDRRESRRTDAVCAESRLPPHPPRHDSDQRERGNRHRPSANSSAMARPIPLDEPVTTAVRPSSSDDIVRKAPEMTTAVHCTAPRGGCSVPEWRVRRAGRVFPERGRRRGRCRDSGRLSRIALIEGQRLAVLQAEFIEAAAGDPRRSRVSADN